MKERKDNFVSKVCSVENGMACNAQIQRQDWENKSIHYMLYLLHPYRKAQLNIQYYTRHAKRGFTQKDSAERVIRCQNRSFKKDCERLGVQPSLGQSIAEETKDASERVSSEHSAETDSSRPRYQSTSQS